MRPWLLGLAACGLVGLIGYSAGQQGRLRPGDTVTAYLDPAVQWTPGRPGSLSVRLQARGPGQAPARALDLAALPDDVNPVADITFYEGDRSLGSVRVPLSHRC